MNKKVECIKRLFKKNQSYHEICDWMLDNELVTQQEVASYGRDQERAEFILETLEQAERDKKFLLLDFEWQVLPIERIKITVVTESQGEVNFESGH